MDLLDKAAEKPAIPASDSKFVQLGKFRVTYLVTLRIKMSTIEKGNDAVSISVSRSMEE
jgi:hypothetical protein